MFVEFVGVPGSGKSTLSRSVAEKLRSDGLAVDEITYELDHCLAARDRVARKLAKILVFAITNPRIFLEDSTQIVKTRQATIKDLAKALGAWSFISAELSNPRPRCRIAILDQGLAQAMWSIGFAARNMNWHRLLHLDIRPIPDLIVHVRASENTVSRRLQSRLAMASRLDRFGGNAAELSRAQKNTELVLSRFRARSVEIIEADCSFSSELAPSAHLVAECVYQWIERNAGQGGKPRQYPHAIVANRGRSGSGRSRQQAEH